MGEGPLAAFDFEFFGHANFQQVADGGRKDVLVAVNMVVLLLKPAARLGVVSGDGRFFGDAQRFPNSYVEIGNALIPAEKPSVASDIAKALGGFKKQDDYFESDQYVLSSAVGHLLEICVPEEYEVKRGKWTFAHLPMIPPHFDLRPIEKAEGR